MTDMEKNVFINNSVMDLKISISVAKLFLQLLEKSDPLSIYSKAVSQDIMAQLSEHVKKINENIEKS